MKDQLSLQRNELFTNGFLTHTPDSRGRVTSKVPSSGVGECATRMVLHPPRAPHRTPYLHPQVGIPRW